ncbi:hypothetical protein M408DRAFT_56029, partial [Serendipita vermifera MAFF 305830]
EYGVLDGEAARDVFRRSGLDNKTLATIWELVDENERGFLEQKGVLRMLRLISCAQRGQRLHARKYENGVPGLSSRAILPTGPTVPLITSITRPPDDPLPALTDKEKAAFIAIFDRNDPQGGNISGAQGLQILSRSQLPTTVLAQIWDLADADRSGSLSKGEFVVAMYLVKLVM